MKVVTVDVEHRGSRLDNFLANKLDRTSRSQWQRLIEQGKVQVNDADTAANQTLQTGDTVSFDISTEPLETTDVSLTVLHEDEHIIAINKPHGLLVHPRSAPDDEPTVVALLSEKLSAFTDKKRPGVVHRLDRDTSGVMVLAKTMTAYDDLKSQFKTRSVSKIYRAVLSGEFEHEQAKITLPIGRDRNNPSKFKVDPNGKPAETKLTTLAAANDMTFVELGPKTGRTHQLRVHCAHISHPIVGDALYGNAGPRLMLHAHKLKITVNNQSLELTAPLPQGFAANE